MPWIPDGGNEKPALSEGQTKGKKRGGRREREVCPSLSGDIYRTARFLCLGIDPFSARPRAPKGFREVKGCVLTAPRKRALFPHLLDTERAASVIARMYRSEHSLGAILFASKAFEMAFDSYPSNPEREGASNKHLGADFVQRFAKFGINRGGDLSSRNFRKIRVTVYNSSFNARIFKLRVTSGDRPPLRRLQNFI